MDWVPYGGTSFTLIAKNKSLKEFDGTEAIAQITDDILGPVKTSVSIDYILRRDGLFIFKLEIDSNKVVPPETRRKLASYTSRLIRQECGFADCPLSAKVISTKWYRRLSRLIWKRPFDTIAIAPVELEMSGKTDEELEKSCKTDEWQNFADYSRALGENSRAHIPDFPLDPALEQTQATHDPLAASTGADAQTKLSERPATTAIPTADTQTTDPIWNLYAKPFGPDQQREPRLLAVVLLRRRFLKSYENAIQVRSLLKGKRLFGLPRYSWQFPFMLWLFCCALAGLYNSISDTSFNGYSLNVNFGFLFREGFLKNLLTLGVMNVFLAYLLIVSLRRNPTIYALERVIKVLQLGNIFIDNLRCSAKASNIDLPETSFAHAIDDVKFRLDEERAKKKRNIWVLMVVFALTFSPLEERLSKSPTFDKLFTVILPWHKSPEAKPPNTGVTGTVSATAKP